MPQHFVFFSKQINIVFTYSSVKYIQGARSVVSECTSVMKVLLADNLWKEKDMI